MKTLSIVTKKRTELGKKSTKALRKDGQVPCVIYGGEEIIHFYAPENDFRHLIYTDQVYLIELDIDGKKIKAVLKDLQFHPVTDKVLHIDFVEVIDSVPTTFSLPVKLVGKSIGIIAGGKLRLRRRYLKVKGLVQNMPELIEIDITKLKIGGVIKVSDIKIDKIELLDAAQSMVVGIVSSRIAAKVGDDIAEEEESTEGEESTESEESTEETASTEA
jgi:large subunit ribosomal protein L25